jgi:hypothetical protein
MYVGCNPPNLQVIELGFFPDEPVETFQAPYFGVATLGARRPHAEAVGTVGSFGSLGPFHFDEGLQLAGDEIARPQSA